MHSRIRDSDSHAMLFCPSFAQMERTKVRQWPHLSASPALKRGAEGFKYCGEVGSLWSDTAVAAPSTRRPPHQKHHPNVPCLSCRSGLTAPISRAAPRAAAMVNPLKRLRIGGDRLYIRVPQFPLSSPTCVKFYYCNRRISGSVSAAAPPRDGPVSAVSARVSPSHAPDPRPAPRRGHWARFEVPDGLRGVADSSGFRWSIVAHSQPNSPRLRSQPPLRQVLVHESTSPWPSARSGRRALCLARPPICRTASWSLWFAWWVSAGAQATCATGCL